MKEIKFTIKMKQLFIFITITVIFLFSTTSSQETDTIDKWETNPSLLGYQNRPRRQANEGINCATNDDCPASKKCKNNKCIHPCESDSCGANTWHSLRASHSCNCQCWSGFTGDPYIKCTKNCTTNNDCDYYEKCESNECTEVCVPGLCQEGFAMCTAHNHHPICTCLHGMTGNPYTNKNTANSSSRKCVPECTIDSDCKLSQKCEDNVCRAASLCGTNSCGHFTHCDVEDGLPICTCLPGYGGDPSIECVKINCVTNNDCNTYMKCDNNNCIPSCDNHSCVPNAYCDVVKGHFPICYCPKGFIGNPDIKCERGCESDDDCYTFRKCELGQCISVCDSSITCGKHASCDVDQNRKPICRCDSGYSGDPYTECRKFCTSDSNCHGYEKCEDNMCTNNECKDHSCGVNAVCDVGIDGATCICVKGYYGDYLLGCVEGCITSADCRSLYETCENRKCVAIHEIQYSVEIV